MTGEAILTFFGVSNPKPSHSAMAKYLAECQRRDQQADNDAGDASEPERVTDRTKLAYALLTLIEGQIEQDLPMPSSPSDLLAEAKWRAESENI